MKKITIPAGWPCEKIPPYDTGGGPLHVSRTTKQDLSNQLWINQFNGRPVGMSFTMLVPEDYPWPPEPETNELGEVSP